MMPIEECQEQVRAALCARIGALMPARPDRPAWRAAVHDIRGLARAHGFGAVVGITEGLEHEMAARGSATIATAYIERLQDALSCGGDARAADAMLASVGARLLV